MSKKLYITVIILVFIFWFFFKIYPNLNFNKNTNEQKTYTTLSEYETSIDYSCETDSDCAIKDVSNCCGYYPKCVNVNAKTNPEFVKQACAKEGIAGVCGFPSISSCKCVNKKCQGF